MAGVCVKVGVPDGELDMPGPTRSVGRRWELEAETETWVGEPGSP